MLPNTFSYSNIFNLESTTVLRKYSVVLVKSTVNSVFS